MNKLNKNIKKELDNYLEFDSSIIFENCDKCLIYGGSIRDIIAGDAHLINDIDVMCAPRSAKILNDLLIKNGYKFSHKLVNKDINEIYKHIHIINEPHTFIKNDKIVQIIRPVIQRGMDVDYTMYVTLKSVDISSCGVYWDGKAVNESYNNAIKHCLNKIFYVNWRAVMFNTQRTMLRAEKLKNKSWTEINESEEVKILRTIKLNEILD